MTTELDYLTFGELNPGPLESEVEQEQMPEPQLLPTSESVLNAGAPEPELDAVITPNPGTEPATGPKVTLDSPPSVPVMATSFDWDSLAVPKLNNYVPREATLPQTDNEGSVFMAYMRQENTIGSFISNSRSKNLAKVDINNFNFAEHLTPEQLPDLPHYALAMSQEEIDDISAQLFRERQDRALMAAHPWQTFGIGLATGPLEITNYLPGGVVYRNAKTAAGAAKAFAAASGTAMFSSATSEALLHNSQLTRTAQESVYNVAVSGILGGAIGLGANRLGKSYQMEPKLEKKAYDNIMNIMIDPDAPPGGGSVGAAQVKTFDDALADIPDIVKKSMVLSPGVRLASSDYKIANKFNSQFVEGSLYTEANTLGYTHGHALETYIKQRKAMPLAHVVEYNNAYYAMLGIEKGPAITKRVRGLIANKDMSAGEFATRVSRALITNTQDANPFVNRATVALRKGFDESHAPLVEMGYLPDTKGTKTSEGYLTIIPNRQLIIEQGGRNVRGAGTYPQAVFDGFKKTQEEIKAFKLTPDYISLDAQAKALKKANKAKDIDPQVKKANKQMIADIDAKIKELADPKMFNSKGKFWKELDDEMLWEQVMQHVDTILSQQSGTLLNPVLAKFKNPNSLKSRTLMVDQESLSPWHLQDPVKLLMMHSRALAPFIEKQLMARRAGFKDFDEMRADFSEKLHSEYDAKAMGKTGKEAAKLERKFRRVEKDMNAILDLLDGVFGQGENTVTSTGFQKFFQNFRAYNYLSMMGNITVQSFNDIGSIMIRNGVFNTMYHGLLPMLTDMRALSKRDLRAINYGLESELGMMTQRFMDSESLSTNPGIFTKSWEAMESVYGDLTLFNQWTGIGQRLSMTTSINHTLDTIHKIIDGKKVAKKDRTRLAQLGLREEYFKYIYDQTSGPNNISSNKTRVADWTTWEPTTPFEAAALRDFQAATAKDIDQTIIQPGVGDRPLIAHNALGKTLFQFKGFGFASTNKILYSAIQRRRDAEVYTGITAMLALGAMSYATTQYSRGEEPKTDLKTLALESIDRSGVMGILMEVFNISQSIGVFGPGEGATRYKSRGVIGAVVGPTFGRSTDIVMLANTLALTAWGEHDLDTTDLKKTSRLLPLANIAYVAGLNDQFITWAGDAFNLPETREGK